MSDYHVAVIGELSITEGASASKSNRWNFVRLHLRFFWKDPS
jgi:hypothetical protein